jgi:hypothetical protein
MPHYKCATCRIRLHVSGIPADQVQELCPDCGALLEPAATLTELMGYRALEPVHESNDLARAVAALRLPPYR